MRAHCALALALLAAMAGGASSLPIRGFAVDATSAEPLPVANVWLEGTGRGTAANLDGYFVINDLEPGRYAIQVSYVGYHTARREVEVTRTLMEPIKIELLPEAVQLDVVEIVANEETATEERLSPRVSTVPVDGLTIRSMPSLMGEMDILRAVQTIPGVKASSDLSSAPYIRGGSPDQTLILMDRNVVYNPSHLFGLFSTFNADAVKRLDLMKGGFPAEYGGRSGSVLDVITNEGNRRETKGLLSLGIISARGALEGPLPDGRGSFALSARRTYFEPILEALRDVYDTDIPDYYFYDANGKVNLDLSQKTTITTAGYLGNDVMTAEFGDTDERIGIRMAWGNRSITGRLRHVLSQNLFLSIGGAVSRYRSNWSFDTDDVLLEEAANTLHDQSLQADLEILGHDRHRVKAGICFNNYDIDFFDRSEDVTWVSVDTSTINLSAYLQDTWRLGPLVEIQPGIRAYYHQAGKHYRVDPRLSLVYHHGPEMRFKLSVGRYTQWINVITFGEGFSNFDIWIPVDASVKPTYTNQTVLGFEYDPREDLQFTTEAYYTDMRNLTTFDLLSDQGDVATDAFVTGRGFAYGLEWMVRRNMGRTTGWIGYSLSWTRRQFPGTYVNNGQWFYPRWDRRHDFIVVANRALSHRWDLSGSWRYNTGQGFTQGLGLYTLREPGVPPDWMFGDGRVVLPGSMNNYRFPADHRLDVTATYNHTFFGLPAKLNLSVYNVYSRRSYWIRYFDTQENPVEVSDLKLLPIVPLISYEVRF
jgi:hypothetical protein